jgi:hypothetical protein
LIFQQHILQVLGALNMYHHFFEPDATAIAGTTKRNNCRTFLQCRMLLWSAHRVWARPGKASRSLHACSLRVAAAKELHFNRDGAALKRMQQGADKLAAVVGVTLGPKGRNVVLESKFGSPKIVNDGVTVAKEVELEDPVENIGSKLVRQAAQKTNDSAGDGTTTATVLAAALIAEGMKVVVAGANPVQVTRGMAKTVTRLVEVLKTMSQVRSSPLLLQLNTTWSERADT